jgi:16S rRNA (cytosine967-C5)-methyltransferase
LTPAAIIAAAIDVLSEQEARPGPIDLILGRYQRSRRYIGSKDRAALGARIFGIARRQARLNWRLAAANVEPTARARIIADLLLEDGLELDEVAELFSGDGYGPSVLTTAEFAWAPALGAPPLETVDMPVATKLECPDWAWPGFKAAFGENAITELEALLKPAPLDLRVNTLKGGKGRLLKEIRAAGFTVTATPYSPLGLRLPERVALGRLPGLQDGDIDPQDEGSQLVAAAVGAQPGEIIADFCAGAGGKALAIAAAMENRGQLYALDTDARRLERSAPRFAKAGVDNVRRHALKPGNDPWIKRQKGRFDRVLVDAPCSGVGAWRRNPDARWSRGQPPLVELTALQAEILPRAARLVRSGGLLVYATCSLLPEENEAQIERFLAAAPEFSLDPPTAFPAPLEGPYLKLTPARHGTDGFFVAWLRRAPKPVADAPTE